MGASAAPSAPAATREAKVTARETQMQQRIKQLEGQVRELQSSFTTMAPSWASRVGPVAPVTLANENNVSSAHSLDTAPAGRSLAELAMWAQADEGAEADVDTYDLDQVQTASMPVSRPVEEVVSVATDAEGGVSAADPIFSPKPSLEATTSQSPAASLPTTPSLLQQAQARVIRLMQRTPRTAPRPLRQPAVSSPKARHVLHTPKSLPSEVLARVQDLTLHADAMHV